MTPWYALDIMDRTLRDIIIIIYHLEEKLLYFVVISDFFQLKYEVLQVKLLIFPLNL